MVTSKTNDDPFKERLETIITSIKALSDEIHVINQRLSLIEGSLNQSPIPSQPSKASESDSVPQVNFNDKDEMLKRAYEILAESPQPMTTQEVAELIGRSRSTTSQYLNELHQRNLLLKTHGTTPDKSRNIVFSAVGIIQEKEEE